MKFTRLMNHSNARISNARSSTIGIVSIIRSCDERVADKSVTAASCSTRRGTTGIGRRSSTMPTTARQNAAAMTMGIALAE